ncbi:MAG: WG repeat-containing protein [Cyclobacteriaceae bacterium]|nr:WG repeat-containing protein [Cyclobacteriaceae bacterium]
MQKIFLLLVFITFTLPSLSQSLLIAAKEKDKKYGYINTQGNYVIAPSFDEAGAFYQGIAVVRKGKKVGVINAKGEFIVPPLYEDAIYYAPEGKVSVKKAGKWGVIDQSGKIIIPIIHEFISVFINGYVVAGKYIGKKQFANMICPVVLNEQNEVIFEVGKPITEDPENLIEYDCFNLFLPGYANKRNNAYSNGWPIVREGILVLKELPEGTPDYANFLALDVRTGKSFSFPQGFQPVNNSFAFREGTIAMEIPESKREDFGDTGMGFYDTTSFTTGYMKEVLSEWVDHNVQPFFNGVAALEKDERWIFINRDFIVMSETQLSPKEYKAFPPMYFNGLIGFWKNGKAGFVDITGKEVIPFTLEEYHPFEYDVTPAKQNGFYGLLRKDGSWAVPPKFEDLQMGPCPCFH